MSGFCAFNAVPQSGGCRGGYLSGARCKLAHGPAAYRLPLTVSFGSVKNRAVKRVCLCVTVVGLSDRHVVQHYVLASEDYFYYVTLC